MRNRLGGLLLAGGVILLSGCAQHPGGAPASKGQALFLNYCVSCHAGAGDPPQPNAAILSSPALQNEDAFRQALRSPSSGMMPPFGETQLDNAAIHALYEYVRAASH